MQTESSTPSAEIVDVKLVPKRGRPPKPQALAVVPPTTPLEMLAIAVQRGVGLEELKQLREMQKEWEADQARKAFVVAMSEFKAHAIKVVRDKTNSQFDSRYVSLGKLVATVTPFLSQHGLSARWDTDQQSTAGMIKVTCIVTHIQGHSESVSMIVPPDTSGTTRDGSKCSKNPIQQIKSAITYAKACTFESICGLASTDANVDDDGNGSAPRSGLTDEVIGDYLSTIADAMSREELQAKFSEAYKAASAAKDAHAQKLFITAKDKRKADLQ